MATRFDMDLAPVTPSPERIQQALESLTEHDVTLVNLQFSDIAGGTRTVTVPVSLMPVIFERGYRFDGAAMAGGQRQVELDSS